VAVAALMEVAHSSRPTLACTEHRVGAAAFGDMELLEVDAVPSAHDRGSRAKRRDSAGGGQGVLQPASMPAVPGLLVTGSGMGAAADAPPPHNRDSGDGGGAGGTDARFVRAGDEAAATTDTATGNRRGLRCSCQSYECVCPRRCGCSLLGDGSGRLMDNATLVPPPMSAPAKPFPAAYTFRCDCGFSVVRTTPEFDSLACTCNDADAGACTCKRKCTCAEG